MMSTTIEIKFPIKVSITLSKANSFGEPYSLFFPKLLKLSPTMAEIPPAEPYNVLCYKKLVKINQGRRQRSLPNL